MIQRDENADIFGFFIGCLIYLGIIAFMIVVPVGWAWNSLMGTTEIGAAVGFGIALIFFLILTVYISIFGVLIPLIGASD